MKVAVGLRRVAAGKRTSGRRAAQIAYRFTLMTYQNQLLRNLQLYYIESDLEQTIGAGPASAK